MEDNMKVIGLRIRGKEEDLKLIKMETSTLATTNMEKLMEREFILGIMEKFMMVSGKKDWNMATDCGKEWMVIHLSENGIIQKQMVLEFMSILMEIDMKALGKWG